MSTHFTKWMNKMKSIILNAKEFISVKWSYQRNFLAKNLYLRELIKDYWTNLKRISSNYSNSKSLPNQIKLMFWVDDNKFYNVYFVRIKNYINNFYRKKSWKFSFAVFNKFTIWTWFGNSSKVANQFDAK